ncbi:hypothetical protein FRC96_04395 [Lujinxingia vulgaris]|uniref:Peptide-N-glycosidase F N-terminal domain-containing protein n=1 Tax=Lujinxingia vulgaris TaxID=2600176 RepID=A0A5C6XDR5_9DELT|nr:peptide-N-glycosidase F-related protein [Lujinxingia vulgaris]TXD41234.1 hypothetical protein FRC96_04395 [Lujinxingia vulgaris]
MPSLPHRSPVPGHLLAILCLAVLSACSSPAPEEPLVVEEEVPRYNFDDAAPWYPCPETTSFDERVVEVVAMDGVHQYFGDEDRRTVDTPVTFPEGDWSQVGLKLELACPEGMVCDHWDRTASLELITNPDAAEDDQNRVELARHITPYRRGMCQYIDLTPLAGLLTGERALRSFIDTWVGPGHEQGEGWEVSATFYLTPGYPEAADEVINLIARQAITVGEVEPDQNVASQLPELSFTLPESFRRVEAHLTTTGHSFGNTRNCAEFCEMRHDLLLNDDALFSVNPWRADCALNPVSPQAGTWEYARNGWCPGAVSVGDRVDLTDAVQPGDNTLSLNILLADGSEYDNTSPVDLLPSTQVALKLYVWR